MVAILTALEHYGFGSNFIKWIKILIKNQESCVINGSDTIQYFRLERRARQGDTILAYLFIFSPLRFFLFLLSLTKTLLE